MSISNPEVQSRQVARRKAIDNPYAGVSPKAPTNHYDQLLNPPVEIKRISKAGLDTKAESVITSDITWRKKFEELEPLRKNVIGNLQDRFLDSFTYLDDETGSEFYGSTVRIEIPISSGDSFHQVKLGEYARPDVISFHFYNTTRLWWVIMDANLITDPFTELIPGTILRIPDFKKLVGEVLK